MIDIEELKGRVQIARKIGMTFIGMTQECAAELIERLEAAERDAARYRWIDSHSDAWAILADAYGLPTESADIEDLSSAIDAAIAKGKA